MSICISICIADLHFDLHVDLHFDLPPPCSGRTAAGHRQDTKEKITTPPCSGRGPVCREGKHLVRPRPSHRRISSRPPTQLRLARTHGTHEHETEIDFPVGVRSLFHVGPTPQPPMTIETE